MHPCISAQEERITGPEKPYPGERFHPVRSGVAWSYVDDLRDRVARDRNRNRVITRPKIPCEDRAQTHRLTVELEHTVPEGNINNERSPPANPFRVANPIILVELAFREPATRPALSA
jgi:hypothetical protein